MHEIIRNCYDSHTHFWATGQVACGLRLHDLRSPEDVTRLKITPEHFRDRWLVGFGWDQHLWPLAGFPDRAVLDRVFPDTPVFFSRVDGHASWLNSAGLAELARRGYDFSRDPEGGRISREADGSPAGILRDQAHIQALRLLPDFRESQHLSFLEKSQSIFNRAGFTHVRDLSMNPLFWRLLRQMESEDRLTVCLDAFVTAENLTELEPVLDDIRRLQRESCAQLRVHGVKIFIDGSLGSETAFLSEPYRSAGPDTAAGGGPDDGKAKGRGLLIWSAGEIQELLRAAWQAGQQVAVHCIGDAAVHAAVSAARQVSAAGVGGRLHLEHVQILRPETLQMMKPLHVTCHLQPCHWLSDRNWLREKLPERLLPWLFPWEALRKNKIPFDFGSDSPIEEPSLAATRRALELSAAWGVPRLNTDWKAGHSHPDPDWGPGHTELEDGEVRQVYFKNRALL